MASIQEKMEIVRRELAFREVRLFMSDSKIVKVLEWGRFVFFCSSLLFILSLIFGKSSNLVFAQFASAAVIATAFFMFVVRAYLHYIINKVVPSHIKSEDEMERKLISSFEEKLENAVRGDVSKIPECEKDLKNLRAYFEVLNNLMWEMVRLYYCHGRMRSDFIKMVESLRSIADKSGLARYEHFQMCHKRDQRRIEAFDNEF